MSILTKLAKIEEVPEFETKISVDKYKRTEDKLRTIQVNVGALCNLACRHCHVGAGPNRQEIMPREVMEVILDVARREEVETIDITGGAPEMNPNFKWFVSEAVSAANEVIVRSNLVILLEEGYTDLINFYKENKIKLVCSLPCYTEENTDTQRGDGVFDKSILVLQKLNKAGYGVSDGLELDLVYNPGGAFLPGSQEELEKDYKEKLYKAYGIVFNKLYTITNVPIGRFAGDLEKNGCLKEYMETLCNSFNEEAVRGMMCRSQISVGYDGILYDCDFNQAIGLPVENKLTILDMIGTRYRNRRINFAKHCYACTAGQGSSCGGALA